DIGALNKFQLYDRMKTQLATPPNVAPINDKYRPRHSVVKTGGVTITTNHRTDALYLPADDRRHHVDWSPLTKEDFPLLYWDTLWSAYEAGGYADIAAYLDSVDLSDFDPKAPPEKTSAFLDIVNANRPGEDAELADILDKMRNPEAVTLKEVDAEAF